MTPVTPTGREVSPWLIAFVVSIATFMEVLDTTIVNVSLRHIAGSLSASQDEVTWVLTSYLVSNGIILPISGWLAGVMGRKRFFMTCIFGFTAASFACGAATSLSMLVFFRLLQGLAGGGLQPTQQAILLDAFPPQKRGAAFAIAGVTMVVAPIIGPALGGWITDNFDWRWVFFINVPVGAVVLLLVARLLSDPEHARAQGTKTIDYIGLSLVALGLGTMQIMLDRGQLDDWFDSRFICTLLAISAAALLAAVAWMLRQKNPVIELRLLKDRAFGLGCVLMFFVGFVLYSSSTLLPLLVQSEFGYDATLAGLVLSPGGLALVFLMPLSGRLVSHIPARRMILFGLALSAFGMWQTTHITPQSDYMAFVWMRVLQVVGLPFLFVPNSTLAFMHIPKEKNNKASSLFSMSRNLGGSVGIALTNTYVVRHQQMRQAQLSEHLSPYNPVYRHTLHGLTDFLAGNGAGPFAATQGALGRLYFELQHQAAILAYNDAFVALMTMMGVGVVLTLLLPANDPHHGKATVEIVH